MRDEGQSPYQVIYEQGDVRVGGRDVLVKVEGDAQLLHWLGIELTAGGSKFLLQLSEEYCVVGLWYESRKGGGSRVEAGKTALDRRIVDIFGGEGYRWVGEKA